MFFGCFLGVFGGKKGVLYGFYRVFGVFGGFPGDLKKGVFPGSYGTPPELS